MNAFDPDVNRAFSCFPRIDSQDTKLRAKSMEDLTLRMTRTSAETGRTGTEKRQDWPRHDGSPPPLPTQAAAAESWAEGTEGILAVTGPLSPQYWAPPPPPLPR